MNFGAARSDRIRRTKPAIALLVGLFCGMVILLNVLPARSQATGGGAAAGDAERGKVLFEKRCAGCHSLDQDREGPKLRGVYGRKAGSLSGFKYSDSLKASKVVWDSVSLERWLTDPESVIPENDMDFRVLKAEERADLIRFLKFSSGK